MLRPTLVLASSSPRRRDILASLGLQFEIRNASVDEQRLDGEPATDMVLRLARAKALSIPPKPGEIVLGADTAVVLGEEIFGKPDDIRDAMRMLERLAGRTHKVLTGVALCALDVEWSAISSTDVQFRDISPDEARRYWQSGEPRDKAGGYAIQGRGGMFVRAIMGSYSGVVGLPVFETASLLQEAGLQTLSAGQRET